MAVSSVLPDIGIGGILAILVIREVLNFLSSKTGKTHLHAVPLVHTNGIGNGNGKDSVSHTELETRLKGMQYKDNCVEIVRRIDDSVAQIREEAARHQEIVAVQYKEIHTMLVNLINRDCHKSGA